MPKLRLTRKKLVVAAVLGVLIVVIGTVAALRLSTPNTKDKEETTSVPIDDVVVAARSKVDEGNVDEGLALLDQQITAEQDNEKKADLLLYKADIATEQKLYDEALDSVEQLERLAPNQAAMFGAYGELYEAQGDKQRAIEYYEKALNALGDDAMRERFGYRWQSKIEELRS